MTAKRVAIADALYAKVSPLFRGNLGREFAEELADIALAALDAAPAADAGTISRAIHALTGPHDVWVRSREALAILRGERGGRIDLEWCIEAAKIEEEAGVTPRAGLAPDADAGRVAELEERVAALQNTVRLLGEDRERVLKATEYADAVKVATLERRIERALELNLADESSPFIAIDKMRAILRGDVDE